MATKLSRIIKYGFQSFYRNGWLSVATIAVMVLVLLVFQGMIIFSVIGKAAISELQEKIDISVYFKPEIAEDDILKLAKAIESLSEVKSVEYVSKDTALETFKAKHQEDSTIANALEELDANPLLASLNVKAGDPRDYSVIASYLENDSLKALVEKVTYAQNRLVIDRLTKIIQTVKQSGFGLMVFLALVASLVIFNTIRIAIYSNREEIGISRFVGAANSFINGPYVVIGILYGAVGATVSLLLVYPTVLLASPYVSVFIPSMNLSAYFLSHLPSMVGYQLFFGIGLGVVSSAIAVRRYLKI